MFGYVGQVISAGGSSKSLMKNDAKYDKLKDDLPPYQQPY